MTKTFGTKKTGSAEPETRSTVQAKSSDGQSGRALKLLFGILSAVAVLLFAYNSYFAPATQTPVSSPAPTPVTTAEPETPALLRGTDSLKTPKFPELDHYLQAHHVNPDRARINRYGRTSTLLAGCGTRFDAVRRDYQRQNHAAYLVLRGSEDVVEDDDIAQPVPPDRGFSRAISARECSYVSQLVRLGEQDI